MKKLATLFLLAGFVLASSSSPASAVDVSVDGEYLFQYQTGSVGFRGANEAGNQQRVRLGLSLSVNENLSGYFRQTTSGNLAAAPATTAGPEAVRP